MRCLSRLLLLAAGGMLASCIDGREEFWLAADGSGRAEIRYEVPAALASSLGGETGIEKLLERFVRETPTLTSTSHRVTRQGERMAVEFKASFKSVLELIAAVSGDSVLAAGKFKPLVEPLIGHFDIRQRGLRVEMTRTVSPSKALPGAGFVPDSRFDGRRLVYILHLPVVAQESNATRTADGGRTLIWDQTLKEGLKKRVVIHFKAAMPLPWWSLAALVVALGLLLGWLGRKGLRRWRGGGGV
ncbi:MAG: hypothetical protein NTW21_32270 [Verrucomicrobia bacterium]|nr:hypothetical protein [Verrucomicrobiota bacterium]